MQEKMVAKFSMTITPVLLVCGVLGLASPGWAGEEDRACTDRTMHGDYGPLNVHFVAVKGGKEVHFVVDTNAVTSIGIKVE